MQVKRYEVATIREASALIRSDLGPDAVILSTKRIHAGRGARIEVVAGRDGDLSTATANGQPAEQQASTHQLPESELGNLTREIIAMKAMLREMNAEDRSWGEWRELRERLDTLFDMFGLRKGTDSRHPLVQVYRHLTSSGISKDRVSHLISALSREEVKDISSCEAGLARIEQCIARRLETYVREGQGKRVKAFFGATGVGKTTTIAKLASFYALEKKVPVGLITIDTYRIAAIEQLKAYARIIGVPLEVAGDKAALKKALQRLEAKDVIFIDTPGKNCRDENYVQYLRECLDLSVPVEANLLLSMTSSEEALRELGRRFGALAYDQIILTKIDECPQTGCVYNIVEHLAKPVSYMTHGQNVPFDIAKASPANMAHLIVRSALH